MKFISKKLQPLIKASGPPDFKFGERLAEKVAYGDHPTNWPHRLRILGRTVLLPGRTSPSSAATVLTTVPKSLATANYINKDVASAILTLRGEGAGTAQPGSSGNKFCSCSSSNNNDVVKSLSQLVVVVTVFILIETWLFVLRFEATVALC